MWPVYLLASSFFFKKKGEKRAELVKLHSFPLSYPNLIRNNERWDLSNSIILCWDGEKVARCYSYRQLQGCSRHFITSLDAHSSTTVKSANCLRHRLLLDENEPRSLHRCDLKVFFLALFFCHLQHSLLIATVHVEWNKEYSITRVP